MLCVCFVCVLRVLLCARAGGPGLLTALEILEFDPSGSSRLTAVVTYNGSLRLAASAIQRTIYSAALALAGGGGGGLLPREAGGAGGVSVNGAASGSSGPALAGGQIWLDVALGPLPGRSATAQPQVGGRVWVRACGLGPLCLWFRV